MLFATLGKGLINGLTAEVGSGPYFSDLPTNQELSLRVGADGDKASKRGRNFVRLSS